MLAFILLFLLFIAIGTFPIYVKFELKLDEKIQTIGLTLSIFKGLDVYKIYLPYKPREYGLFYIDLFKKYGKLIKYIRREYLHVVRYAKSKCTIEDIDVQFRLGLADARDTAILCGALGAVANMTYEYLAREFKTKGYNQAIEPIFNREIVDIDIICIMSMRTGYIIIVIVKFLYRKILKAVKRKWQTNIQ